MRLPGKPDFAPETKAPEHPQNAAESGLFARVFRLCDLPAV